LPRIPRKKLTTTTTEATVTEEEPVYIDPNCNRNLVNMYCEKMDYPLMKYLFGENKNLSLISVHLYSDEFYCNSVYKYSQCFDTNFRIRCQETFQETFNKLRRITETCKSNLNSKAKRKEQNKNGNESINQKVHLVHFIFILNTMIFFLNRFL
jgi:hypothetical protein